jgi:hypothetical protein
MELGDHTGPRVIADPVKLDLFEQYFAKLQ